MASRHTVQGGETLASIAQHYSFGTVDPIEQHPDNAELLQQRGANGLQSGDVLTIPDGRTGEVARGTGRGHSLTLQRIEDFFEIRLFTAFHKENSEAPGDKIKRNKEGTWFGIHGKKRTAAYS